MKFYWFMFFLSLWSIHSISLLKQNKTFGSLTSKNSAIPSKANLSMIIPEYISNLTSKNSLNDLIKCTKHQPKDSYTNAIIVQDINTSKLNSKIKEQYINPILKSQENNSTFQINNNTKEKENSYVQAVTERNISEFQIINFIQIEQDNLCTLYLNSSTCLKCKPFATLNKEEKRCQCQKGYYNDIKLNYCQKCHPLCEECTGASINECSKCKNNSTLSSSTCMCNAGLIYDEVYQKCVKESETFKLKTELQPQCDDTKNEMYYELINMCMVSPNNAEREIKYASIIFLSGIKTPKTLNETGYDILGQQFELGESMLTNEGIRSSYLAGKYLEEKYLTTYVLADKSNINSDNVQISSSQELPTIQSAYAMMLGMFSNSPSMNYYRKEEMNDNSFDENSLNPFDSSPEISTDLATASHSLPLIPVFASLQDNSEINGVANINNCKGIDKIKKKNIKEYKTTLNNYAKQLTKKLSEYNVINKSEKSLSIEELQTITDSFLINYNLGNDNITSKNIDIQTQTLIDEFNTKYEYDTVYGDEEKYVEKIVISSWIKRIKRDIYNKISLEKETILNIIHAYLNNNIIDTSPFLNQKLFNFEFPDEILFVGLSKILSLFEDVDKKINHSNLVMIDLYKKGINNYTVESMIKTFAPFEKEKMTNNLSLNKTFNLSKEVTFKTPSNISEYEFLLESLFNNSNLYSVKIYLDNMLIVDSELNDFITKIESLEITDKEFQEIDKFCNPTPVSPWWISLCVFSSLVILEGLTLVGIHLFLK